MDMKQFTMNMEGLVVVPPVHVIGICVAMHLRLCHSFKYLELDCTGIDLYKQLDYKCALLS